MRPTRSAALAALLASTALHAAPSREVLPFVTDDYPKALAKARATKKPIFLEAWAPW